MCFTTRRPVRASASSSSTLILDAYTDYHAVYRRVDHDLDGLSCHWHDDAIAIHLSCSPCESSLRLVTLLPRLARYGFPETIRRAGRRIVRIINCYLQHASNYGGKRGVVSRRMNQVLRACGKRRMRAHALVAGLAARRRVKTAGEQDV